ncbi:MAG: serine/threonine protein kinase [Sandaracinaceae bacterium]|nr:serine/threonine protein kinase [Sandaracinaceae bacterium]
MAEPDDPTPSLAPTDVTPPPASPDAETLDAAEHGTPPPASSPRVDPAIRSVVSSDRYVVGEEIGRGGMGAVYAWSDPHIGREVAAKVLLADDERARARFFHEARTQGRLAHPSIVPVYDLAALPDGSPFFTMQRVQGSTLATLLAEAEGARFTTRKLLEALARIALAVDFAHVRGVIHRDLKPANLMLGDFGEVYVLDWGIARQLSMSPQPDAPTLDASMPEGGLTARGTLLGTPGYMATEQARGDLASLDARTDVYALGCVLFEILAREPLHRGERAVELITSTLSATTDRSPQRRAPGRDIAPELDALCQAATHPSRDERLGSARALAEGLERYLEGDRDTTLRNQAAQQHARRAARLSDKALGKGVARAKAALTDEEAEEARKTALLEVSRAVALRPDHPLALATLVALLTEPPKVLPEEVRVELDEQQREHVRVGGRLGALAYGACFGVFAGLGLFGLVPLDGPALACLVLSGVAAVTSYAFSRAKRSSVAHSMVMLVLSTLALASISALFGPLIGAPTAVCANTMIFLVSNGRRVRAGIVACGAIGTVLPLGLELIGLIPPSFRFDGDSLVLLPRAFAFGPGALIVLMVTFLATTIIASLALAPFRDDLDATQQKSRVLAWQLRQFVPRSKSDDSP